LRLHPHRLAELSPDKQRYWTLLLDQSALHDRPAPGICTALIRSPRDTSSTSHWIEHRSICARHARKEPDNPFWSFCVDECDAVLAWRETVSVGDRFWKPDPSS
jgi:hypothetical protein